MSRRISLAQKLALALVAGSAATILWGVGALTPFERPVGDLLLRLLPDVDPAGAPVAVLAIDDEALAAHGSLPWPRERIARLVDAAFDAGARGVALDLILAEPRTDAGDGELSRALSRGRTTLAAALLPDGDWALPLPRFGGAAEAAHAEAEIDGDGVVREILATKQHRDLSLPALSLVAAGWVRPDLPIVPGGTIRPDFRLHPGRVSRVGAGSILPAGSPSPAAFRDAVVFLGVTAAGAGDQFVAPTGGGSPVAGVLLHASAAEAQIRGGTLRRAGALWTILACLALALLAQALRDWTGRVRLIPMVLVGVALFLVVLAGTGLAGVQAPVIAPLAAFALSSLLRETAESTVARRQTGELLHRLLAEAEGSPATREEPRGAAGRLELARALQSRVIRDRNLRRTLLNSLEDGVVRWDEGGGPPLVANDAAERLWGHPPRLEELRDSDPDLEPGPGPEPGEELQEETRRHRSRLLRIVVRRVEGGWLGVLRDVTAEEELESRRREMQRLVSHELKTPLAAITNFGEMLERYELSRDELRRLGELIGGESRRLLKMVRTFLDLERLGRDRDRAGERVILDLGELVEERLEVLKAAVEEHTLTLEREGRATVRADEDLLARVVDNLVGNALSHTPAGTSVRLRVEGGGDEVFLRVRDDGPGIEAEALPHLFERFYRGPGASSEGTGLGLALVREITEWHGGSVEVASEPGRGATFTLRFPAGAETEAA